MALGASTTAASKLLPQVPAESITINGPYAPTHGHARGRHFEGLVLSKPKHITVQVRCDGCSGRSPVSHRFVAPANIHRLFIPASATLVVRLSRKGYATRITKLALAGSPAVEPVQELCIQPHSKPAPCTTKKTKAERLNLERLERAQREHEQSERAQHERAEHERAERERLERERGEQSQREREVAERETREREAREHEPPPNRRAITSVDGTLGDRAPYDNVFTIADQPFEAWSSRITYAGVTVANPALPVGPGADKLQLRLCDQPDCSGTVLAEATTRVNNYGLTTASLGEVAVTPFQTYYLVWTPPAEGHGSAWRTFWRAGTPYITGSLSTESVVRGNDGFFEEGARSIISYDGAQPTPAPYSGPFSYAFQNFKAASDTITELGVVVGNAGLARGAEGVETIHLRLCETPDCSSGVLASANPFIVNYGLTTADIGDVPVNVGQTYFVNWLSPHKYEGNSWQSFWLGQGPLPEEASLMQALAKGYDRISSQPPSTYHDEQSGFLGSPTFKDPVGATGGGQRIVALEHVEVACRVFAPQIESAEPGGYWYKIHSAPWNDSYYAVANTFWNGVGPGEGGEPVNTDYSVPNC